MTQTREELDRLVRELETQRDALRVKLHLLKADAREQWEELERQLEHLKGKAKVIGREASGAAAGVKEKLEDVAQELKRGYERIRRLL